MDAIGGEPDGLADGGRRPAETTWGGQKRFSTLKQYRSLVIKSAERRYFAELMAGNGDDVDRAHELSGFQRARVYQLVKKYGPNQQSASFPKIGIP